MKRVRIFNHHHPNASNMYDWGIDDRYNKCYTIVNDDSFTHAVLQQAPSHWNSLTEILSKTDRNNIVGVSQEPGFYANVWDNSVAEKYASTYYVGSTNNYHGGSHLSDIFTEHNSYLYPFVTPDVVEHNINHFPEKTHLMTYVASKKGSNNLEICIEETENGRKELIEKKESIERGESLGKWHTNHKDLLYCYRHILAQNILRYNLPIDIQGSIGQTLLQWYQWNDRYYDDSSCDCCLRQKADNGSAIFHRPFQWDNVHNVYNKYKFCVVVENIREPEYFSEKIIVPLLCGCIPIYLGCYNIDKYFKDYVIKLTGNVLEDINILTNIVNDPEKYYKQIDIAKVKEVVHLKNVIHKEFLS